MPNISKDTGFTAADGDRHGMIVRLAQVYDISEIDGGGMASVYINISASEPSEKWDRDSLLQFLGI